MDHKQAQNPSELPRDELELLQEPVSAEEAAFLDKLALLQEPVSAEEATPVDKPELLQEPVSAEETAPPEELLIGEPMAAPLPVEEKPTELDLDDQELQAILRAAFSEIPGNEDAPEHPSLSDDTILMEPVSARDTAEEAYPEEEEETEAYLCEEMEVEEAEEPAMPKKRRPKNPHAYGFFGIPHIVSTVIWLALVIFIGAGLGRMVWQVAADMLAFGRENRAVTVTIVEDDDMDDIADKLYNIGLIRYKGVFKFYGNLANAEKKIKPGTYHLNTIYDYNALVKKMSSYGARATTEVVIPEGYTCAQIFQLLEQKGVCTAAKLEQAAMNADLSKYWFLEGVDRGSPNCLEGYLYPDTYLFYLDHEADSVLAKLLSTFELRFTEAMREKLDALNVTLADMMRSHGLSESYIENNAITIRELVIIASMIERETSSDKESYYISSVIYNRLTNPGEYPFLNIDAALVYAVGHSPLTNEDKAFDSPYNTYLYTGLIPGPIANPGMASLNAALSPESTEFYFYALNPNTGTHEFFKTHKAHQEFLESLRNGGE